MTKCSDCALGSVFIGHSTHAVIEFPTKPLPEAYVGKPNGAHHCSLLHGNRAM